MASFAYRGRNADGATVNGRVEAPNLDAAAEQLFGNRITPLDIREAEDTATGNVSLRQILSSDRISDVERITFARQMHNLTKAGLPLDRAIRGLEASLANPGFKRVLRDVVANLERGNTLADALAQHPKVFNDLFISLVNVGENTGRLDLAFADLAKYIEVERTTSKQLKSATRYPMFVLAAMAGAIAVITVFVIPAFSGVFERMGTSLPWQTKALITTSDFAVTFWPLIVGLSMLSYGVFKFWSLSHQGGIQWPESKLGSRLLAAFLNALHWGGLQKPSQLWGALECPSFGRCLSSQKWWATSTSDQKLLRWGVGSAEASLYTSLLKEATSSSLLVLQMIAVGEESGNLPDLLDEVSDFYDGEIEYDLNRLTESIEPILIIFIAALVLILALGVFLPIWDLGGI